MFSLRSCQRLTPALRNPTFCLFQHSKPQLVRMQSSSSSIKKRRPTAGIIIIGDEILKGQTQDVNTFFLAGQIKQLGVDLCRVSVISDGVDIIADEVSQFSDKFDLVFTSGGVGPTHDDLTFEGIAKAFGVPIQRNPKLVDIINNWTAKTSKGNKEKPAESRYKLAEIPSIAELNFATAERVALARLKGIEVAYPLVTVNNVFVFPGIPFLLRKSFENIAIDLIQSRFGSTGETLKRPIVTQVFVTESEWFITDKINLLVSKHPSVTFGSYPEWIHSYYKTKLTLECESQSELDAAVSGVHEIMPTINYDSAPGQDSLKKIQEFKNSGHCTPELAAAIDESIGAINQAFDDFPDPAQLIISLNGGKDCVVVVHLVHAIFDSRKKPGQSSKLKSFYIREKDPFQEVEDFIEEMIKMYSLDVTRLDGPMKPALDAVFKRGEPLKGCFLGTRVGDPGSEYQGLFSQSDGDWPPMMRINPILNWDYHMIWQFIRGLSLAYPTLYDKGYTSLGNRNNTKPNPHLKIPDSKDSYKPAHLLEKGEWERDGRL